MDTTPFVKCQKIGYKDKDEAIKALHRIINISSAPKKPVRAYECDSCLLWHLTSREIDKPIKGDYKLKLDWSKILNKD